MANLSFDRSNGRPLPHSSITPPSVSTRHSALPTPPSFSGFQFKEIGKQPTLLQRISAPGPDANMYSNLERSPSLSPDLADEPLPTTSYSETSNIGQLSLQERLSLLEPSKDKVDNIDIDLPEPEPEPEKVGFPSRQSVPPDSPSAQILNPGRSRSTISGVSIFLERHKVDDPSPVSAFVSNNGTKGPSNAVQSQNLIASASNSVPQLPTGQPSYEAEPTLSSASTTIAFSSATTSTTNGPSLASLRVLHKHLVSALTHLNPGSTSEAMRVAQSTKDQCAEVLSSARQAHELAEQALASAQQSMAAARKCFTVAESIQMRSDEFMTAVERINSTQGPTIVTLEDLSHQLDQWTRDMQTQDAGRQRGLEEKEADRRRQAIVSQLQRSDSISRGLGISIPGETCQHQATAMDADNAESNPLSVEDEADAAARAWNQQRAERRKQAAEALSKCREAEETLEQERKKALAEVEARDAELARVRGERIEAEEQERARQEREELEAKRIQEEALQNRLAQRKASEERALKAANEKKAAQDQERAWREQEELDAKRIQEEAQKRLAQRKASEERALKAANEKKAAQVQKEKEDRLRVEQEQKRLEVDEQKRRASAEEAKRIQEDRAKVKLANQASHIQNSLTPPTTASSLPLVSSSQAGPPVNAPPRDVVSKKTLLTGSPDAGKKHKPVSGNVRVSIASSDSSVGPSSSSPFMATTSHASAVITLPVDDRSHTSTNSLPAVPSPNRVEERPSTQVQKSGSVNVDGGSINKPSPTLSLPQRENALVMPSQSARNMVLPTVESLPAPSTPKSQANIIAGDFSVDTESSDLGNVPLVHRSRVLPISPEAQKANLRRLMHASGIPNRPIVKQDPEEEKPLAKLEWNSTAPVSEGGNFSKSPIKIGPPRKKTKVEILEDIPLLSLPSPPALRTSHDDVTVAQTSSPSTQKSKRKLPNFKRKTAVADPSMSSRPSVMPPTTCTNDGGSATLATVKQAGSTIVNPPVDLSAAINRNLASASVSLPARPIPAISRSQSIPEVTSRISITNDFDDRMGPDAAATDGWSQQAAIHEDLSDQRQRVDIHAPRIDHHSPSPPPAPSSNDRGPPSRSRPPRSLPPRRVDHYSPERSLASTSYGGYPRNSVYLSSRSTSANDSRAASPDQGHPLMRRNSRPISPDQGYPPMRRDSRPTPDQGFPPVHRNIPRSLSPDTVPLIGRKRVRADQDDASPPNRRSRYEVQPPREVAQYDNVPRPRYSSGSNQYQEEWSHTAAYARSPSPEAPRLTPLSQRLEPEPETRDPIFGYNANPVTQRFDSQSRRQANFSVPSSHGSTSHALNYPPSNSQRQNYRNPNNDSRPQLLNRFTDSAALHSPPPAASDTGYFPSNRGTRPRVPKPNSRANAQLPLDHRITNKGSLINRMNLEDK